MLNLMKLEMKKNKMGWYFKGVVLANLIIVLFMCFMPYAEGLEGNPVFSGVSEALSVIGTFVRVTFVIFASVLFAKLIIDEYKNNTISVLFTYPIQRKKIILAKILLITGVTFIVIVLSNVFVSGSFMIVNHYLNLTPYDLTSDRITSELINIVVQAIAATGMSLICLYFGMRKKSVPTTIVSSLLIIGVVNSNNGGFTLSSIIAIPLTLAVIGVCIAYFTFRNIDRVDIV
ncbi:MAG TPA: ABC transporter permease [Paenibacillus sp.]|jgi:ABC-type transport system involved in multi-copper enzyme maturation permease subunit